MESNVTNECRVRLSRYHSILYSGVFVERIFRVFDVDAGTANIGSQWGLQAFDPSKGVNIELPLARIGVLSEHPSIQMTKVFSERNTK